MCGIIGIYRTNKEVNAVNEAIDVLKRLEYRGYDSAGVAILDKDAHLNIQKEVGKIANLEKKILSVSGFSSDLAIGHTRWATHGKVSTENAHPHYTDKVAVVHNGIIENYKDLRERMQNAGYTFKTQTDTEVIAILITYYLDLKLSPKEAFLKTIEQLEGAFATVAMFEGQPEFLAFAKQGSPMVIGRAEDKSIYICSDINAIADFICEATYLNDGDVGFCGKDGNIFVKKEKEQQIQFSKVDENVASGNIGDYETFMLKEIMEQPSVIGGIINHYFSIKGKIHFNFPKFPFSLRSVKDINIVACGTSYNTGVMASYYFEKYAGVNVNVHIASELHYRDYNYRKGGVFIFISQSGETADTVATLKIAKEHKQHIIAITNTPKSMIDRLADATLYCNAGVETGVASTKACTAQLSILIMLAIRIGLKKNIIKRKDGRKLAHTLLSIGSEMTKITALQEDAKRISQKISGAKNIIIVGRNVSYGVAMEGALKIKEITYIPTEAIASGELKHGHIALIDDKTPVIVVGIPDHTFQKTCSNVEEIIARSGQVIMISDKLGVDRFSGQLVDSIKIPTTDNIIAPLMYIIVLQLIAYYTARLIGNDIDKPRNLAKSVTVE